MTKKISGSNSQLFSVVVALSIILFIGATGLAIKYLKLRMNWRQYAVKSVQSFDQKRSADSIEDATMLATTVGQFPGSNPLYKQSAELQKYVAELSQQTKRDIVVIDTKKVILADTIVANVGQKFAEDAAGEVTETLADGKTREFVEKSKDYPQGIFQVVVPVKNGSGTTVGAVILSSSHIFD